MKYIIISGKKQNGKDTIADYLIEKIRKHGYSCKKISFADPVKDFCINTLGLKREYCYGTGDDKKRLTHLAWEKMSLFLRDRYKDKTGYMTYREVLEVFGTDIIRNMFYGDTWLEAPIRKDHGVDFVIIPDARFPNEINIFKDMGMPIVRVVRDDVDNSSTSEAETALDDYSFDKIIYNNGTIADLYKKIDLWTEEKELPNVC